MVLVYFAKKVFNVLTFVKMNQ